MNGSVLFHRYIDLLLAVCSQSDHVRVEWLPVPRLHPCVLGSLEPAWAGGTAIGDRQLGTWHCHPTAGNWHIGARQWLATNSPQVYCHQIWCSWCFSTTILLIQWVSSFSLNRPPGLHPSYFVNHSFHSVKARTSCESACYCGTALWMWTAAHSE